MFQPSDFKKCNKCLVYKSKKDFHKKQYTCKICRLSKVKDDYLEKKKVDKKNKTTDRIPIRNEFFKLCLLQGVTLEEYNKYYVPFEKYDEMKKQPDVYSFCELPKCLMKLEKEAYKLEYIEKKYWLDVVYVTVATPAGTIYYDIHII